MNGIISRSRKMDRFERDSMSERINTETLGGRIVREITSRGYPSRSEFLRDVEEKTGVKIDPSNFTPFLKGTKNIGRDKLMAVAGVLGVSVEYLVTGKEPEQEEYLYYQTKEIVNIVESIPDDTVRNKILLEAHRTASDWKASQERLRRLEEMMARLGSRVGASDLAELKTILGFPSFF